jgi:hypothetical protein
VAGLGGCPQPRASLVGGGADADTDTSARSDGGADVPGFDGGADVLRSDGGTDVPRSDGSTDGAASLTLAPAPGSAVAFGSVPDGSTQNETFVVTNTGDQESSALSVNLSPATGSGFTMLSAAAGDCVSGMTTLAGHTSCTVRVQFAPTASGMQSASLGASASVGGTPTALMLTGTGFKPGSLQPPSTTVSLGNVEVGSAAGGSVMLMNGGDMPTGTLTLSNGDPAEIAISPNGCTGTLGVGASCTISFQFTPSASGARSGTFTVSASPGGSAAVTVTATGSYTLTVVRAGTTNGTVSTVPSGLSCNGAICAGLFAGGTALTVQARTVNGGGSFFSGYSGGGCVGPGRDCMLTLNADTTVVATFTAMNNNLVFVTSGTFPATLGSAAAYDAKCNAAATAAGINDTGGASYVAVTSDTTSTFTARLGTSARGWVRMDGHPFGDTQSSLIPGNAIFNSVRYDETGAVAKSSMYMTGVFGNGTATDAGSNCDNWTSTSTSNALLFGQSEGGPFDWTYGALGASCASSWSILCMGKIRGLAVSPVVTSGRKIWTTATAFTIGGAMTPDQFCQAQMPAGVTAAAALIATTTKPASSVLNMTMNYVRPDGTLVGTGAQIAAGGVLPSGIWQSADSVYRGFTPGRVLTGATAPTALGTVASTCGNWTDTTQVGATAGLFGEYGHADPVWWEAIYAGVCNNTGNIVDGLYCVQTAP